MDLSQINMLGKAELTGPGHSMTAMRENNTGAGWRKPFALLLGVAAGWPADQQHFRLCLLVTLAVVIFCSEVSAQPRAWIAAVAIVGVGALAQLCWRRRASM